MGYTSPTEVLYTTGDYIYIYKYIYIVMVNMIYYNGLTHTGSSMSQER